MMFEVVVIGALFLYLVIDYYTYKKLEFLLMNHNILLLYHTYFLKDKYEDYGEPIKGNEDA